MLFGKIISATGLDASQYPKVSEMTIDVFDKKNCKMSADFFNKSTKIRFSDRKIKGRFESLLAEMEEMSQANLRGRYSKYALILYLPEDRTEIFLLQY